MLKWIKYIPVFFVLTLFTFNSFSQSKAELESKRKETEKKITLTQKLLAETNEKQKESIGYLTTLNSQIQAREELISTLRKEVKYLDESISDNEDVIISMEKDIEVLKEEYARMVRFAYKNRNAYSKIGFILSAETFNQSYKRLKLLQNYSEYRKNQLKLIKETKAAIEEKVKDLNHEKKSKITLLDKQNTEKEKLEGDKQKQANVVNTLKSKEKQLKQELAEHKKVAEALRKRIKALIEAELSKKSNAYYLTPAAKKLSLEFANNRGKLPWPVERGFISEYYGKKEVQGFHNVYKVNNGIRFKTVKDADARAIFSGSVQNIISIPGAGKSVLINHGEYFTVYSNLTDVIVKAGDKVQTKQLLGKIRYNPKDGSTEMELQIWKLKQHLNPTYWILSR